MRRWFIYTLSILMAHCISPYDPKIEADDPKLIVDGLITDLSGPQKVVLSYSAAYNNNNSVFGRYETHANVIIQDNEGIQTPLYHTRSGIYESPHDFRGQVGKSYFIKITLPDGKEYQSTPDELNYVPPIDTILGEYQEFSEGFLRGQFNLFLEFSDSEKKDEFYSFTWSHYKFEKYCSIVRDIQNGVTYVQKCCENCWSFVRCNGCINLLSDRFINGKKARVSIANVPYDSKEPYFISIEQRSLTKVAHAFWTAVDEQINNAGGVFDRPPVTIRGNVFRIGDEEEQVLGFFGASSVQRKSVHFDRSKVGKPPFGTPSILTELPLNCVPCEVGPYRTTQIPAGW